MNNKNQPLHWLFTINIAILLMGCGCTEYVCKDYKDTEGFEENQTVRFTSNDGEHISFQTTSVDCSIGFTTYDDDVCTCVNYYQCGQRFTIRDDQFNALDHSYTKQTGIGVIYAHIYFSTAHFESKNYYQPGDSENIIINGGSYEAFECVLVPESETSDNIISSVFFTSSLGVVRINTKDGKSWTRSN